VVDVVTAVKGFGTRIRRFQQIAQSRYGTVVQKWGAQPYSIQRNVGIAIGFSKTSKPPGIARVKQVHVGSEFVGERIQPPAIGGDFLDGRDFSYLASAKIVTLRAVPLVNRSAPLRQGLVNGVRKFRRFQAIHEP